MNMPKHTFVAAVCLMMAACASPKVDEAANLLDADSLKAHVSASQIARIEDGKLTGSHVIVYQNGKEVLNECYGLKGVDCGAPLCGGEVFRIASMTKPVTALALLIEHDRGHLDINDNLSDYLPEFARMNVALRDSSGSLVRDRNGLTVSGDPAVNPIKLYQLVSHTSGVGEVTPPGDAISRYTLDSAVAFLATRPLDFEPGTAQAYSTGAFDVAAMVVEKVSGLEFEEYLKKNIFDKLGMTNTTFEPSEDQWGRMVAMHGRTPEGANCDVAKIPGCVFESFPAAYHAAGAALASTAEDYIKFAQMFLDGGRSADGKKVISEKTLALYSQPVVDDTVMPGIIKWGLGVRVVTGEGYVLPEGTFGWSGAYGTHFWIDPVNNIAAVHMKNSAYDGGAGSQTGNEFEVDVMRSFAAPAEP